MYLGDNTWWKTGHRLKIKIPREGYLSEIKRLQRCVYRNFITGPQPKSTSKVSMFLRGEYFQEYVRVLRYKKERVYGPYNWVLVCLEENFPQEMLGKDFTFREIRKLSREVPIFYMTKILLESDGDFRESYG